MSQITSDQKTEDVKVLGEAVVGLRRQKLHPNRCQFCGDFATMVYLDDKDRFVPVCDKHDQIVLNIRSSGSNEIILYCPSNWAGKGKEEKTREAYHLLLQAGVPNIFGGPDSDAMEPYVRYNLLSWRGIDDIKRFIERWKAGELPQI